MYAQRGATVIQIAQIDTAAAMAKIRNAIMCTAIPPRTFLKSTIQERGYFVNTPVDS